MNDSLTLTTEVAISILKALDLQNEELSDYLVRANKYAPETVGFWESRIADNEEARRVVSLANWSN
jgi:hypothetical protein